MTDPIEEAIAATEAVPFSQFDLNFERGRTGKLVLPADLSTAEMLMLIGLLATQVGPALATAQARKAPRILVPVRDVRPVNAIAGPQTATPRGVGN